MITLLNWYHYPGFDTLSFWSIISILGITGVLWADSTVPTMRTIVQES